jgi:hypothetical protein
MFYKPHFIQKDVAVSTGKDDWGNPIPPKPQWETVGEGRCDDKQAFGQTATYIRSEIDGKIYQVRYHICYDLFNPEVRINEDDSIRAIDKISGEQRGDGTVIRKSVGNYLGGREIWM